MIASLTGQVAALEERSCVIDVGGVGYLVHASARTLAALPAPPAPAHLLIETQLREDAILLYAFSDPAERAWFRLLTAVQGVGAKVALAILSTFAPAELGSAIASGEKDFLTRAPGVGPKLAQRLLGELREPAARLPASLAPAAPPGAVSADALSALLNLGYRRTEACTALGRAAARLPAGAALEALVREGLKELAK
ncbi:MAG TPA: Holliday junction branch migration protein RuvA [Acetobacteraceae bacterium]|jgi:holliday junction DNA helicase RuvA|nr:Holliday junction branch migration protein RuvA [Acetobacteraceae bacterium]